MHGTEGMSWSGIIPGTRDGRNERTITIDPMPGSDPCGCVEGLYPPRAAPPVYGGAPALPGMPIAGKCDLKSHKRL